MSSPIFSTAIGLLLEGVRNLDLSNGKVVQYEEENGEETGEETGIEKEDRFF